MTTASLSPVIVRILSVIPLSLFETTMPVTPRFCQSRRSISFFLAMSLADITMIRRTPAVAGSTVSRTRSPMATSVTWIAAAFFRSVSPGATRCAIVSAVNFATMGGALSGLISISAVSGLIPVTVPTRDLVWPASHPAASRRIEIAIAVRLMFLSVDDRSGRMDL